MKWIDKMLQWFRDKPEEPDTDELDLGESIVCFYLNDEGEVFVECQIPTSEEQAMSYGILLAKINNGAYGKNIYEIVEQVAMENPAYGDIVTTIIKTWQESTNYINNIKDQPIVHPLHVFKQSRFRGE